MTIETVQTMIVPIVAERIRSFQLMQGLVMRVLIFWQGLKFHFSFSQVIGW